MGASKRPLEWQGSNTSIATPSQLRAHLDACKEWLLAVDETYAPDDIGVVDVVDVPGQKNGNIGLRTRTPQCNRFDCFVCGVETEMRHGSSMTANPFTRSSSMLVCLDCCAHLRDLDRQ